MDSRPYNTEYVDVTWETCDLREWLNGEFYIEAFSEAKRKQIEEVVVKAEDNETHGTDAGNDTRDKVFLLSVSEAENFFKNDDARICYQTEYAWTQGRWIVVETGACGWLLRSPGSNSCHAVLVRIDGAVNSDGISVNNHCIGVRPALWIHIKETDEMKQTETMGQMEQQDEGWIDMPF